MSEQHLHDALRELKARITELDHDATSRARLDDLVSRIERHLDDPGDAGRRHGLVENARDTLEHFEVEHPTLTAVLNDLMVALGNMGI